MQNQCNVCFCLQNSNLIRNLHSSQIQNVIFLPPSRSEVTIIYNTSRHTNDLEIWPALVIGFVVNHHTSYKTFIQVFIDIMA